MSKSKRILSAILVICLMLSMLSPSAVAASEVEIGQQIQNIYGEALKSANLEKFDGYCGLYVSYQTKLLGINTDLIGGNGNTQYDTYDGLSTTTGGYNVTCYSSSSYTIESALNTISDYGTTDVYNILVGFTTGSGIDGQKYGHVCFIHAIIGGNVYFSESFNATIDGHYYPEGSPVVCSIEKFAKYYNGWTTLDGLVHFTEPINRYSVLILDTSGSMSGTPAEKQKPAAIKFCQSILATSGANYVAIVKLNSTSSIECNFTNDIDVLTNYINSIPASGGTNINQALQVAGQLLDGVSGDAATVIKNIVLCSDGLPESGSTTTDGPYTSLDYWGYKYANYCYNTAATLKEKYNLYTLGFFHSLNGSELLFANRFMSELQNAGYYKVTDPEQLEFTFGEIADDITDPTEEDDSPIIVIPGIMGSKLYSDKALEDLVWGTNWAVINFLDSNGKKLAIEKTLYTGGLKKEESTDREYGTVDTYQNLIDFLCDEYSDRDVYFYSYDWRQSNADSAEGLYTALAEKGIEKANFICHSMGGLVISQYINEYGNDSVQTVITLGTPYEGAPRLLEAVLTTKVLDGGIAEIVGNPALLFGGLTDDIKRGFLGVGELTPTEESWSYNTIYGEDIDNSFQTDDTYFVWNSVQFQNLHTLRLWLTTTSLGPEQLLKEQIGRWLLNLEDTYKASGTALYDISVKQGAHSLEIVPICCAPSTLTYQKMMEIIYGEANAEKILCAQSDVQSGIKTLQSMDNACFAMSNSKHTMTGATLVAKNGKVTMNDASYGWGDGTVPFYSANMLSDQIISTSEYFDLDHSGLAGKTDNDAEWTKVKHWISSILESTRYAESSTTQHKGYTVIRIACPVEATIEFNGEVLSSAEYIDTADFGRMDLIGENGEIKMFCIDSGNDYNITITGTGIGQMDLAIRFFDENGNLLDERQFIGVPITDRTGITMDADPKEKTTLHVDEDGDGYANNTWTANQRETITGPDSESVVIDWTPAITYCTLSFDTKGGNTMEDVRRSSGSVIDLSDYVPVRDGYIFEGWYSNEDLTDKITGVTLTQNVEIYAKWAKDNSAATTDIHFTDVIPGNWYYDYVMDMAYNEVINGYPDGSFRPQGKVTWGEALKLILKATGDDELEVGVHWASGYMAKALAEGLIDREMDLDSYITRAEMADLTAKAMKLAASAGAHPFEDEVNGYAVALYEAGIITGSLDDGHLLYRGDSTISRAEIATIIWRVYNR